MSQGGKGGSGGGDMGGQNVFNQAASSLTGAQNYLNAGQQANNPMNYGAAIQPYMNPYTQNVIGRSMGDIRQNRDEALNQVGGDAALAGAFGGSRHGLVEGGIYRDAFDTAGDVSANLWNQNFQQAGQGFNDAFGRNLAGSQALGGLGGQQFDIGRQINQDQIGSGDISRGINQDVLDNVQNMFGQYTGQGQSALETMLSVLQGNPMGNAGSGSSTTSTDDGGAAMMQTIGSLIGAFAMFSSRRFKTDIKKDDRPSRLYDINTYDYNYKPSMKIGEPQYGMIAEELAEVFPAAVINDVHGNPVAVNAVPLVAELIKTVKHLKQELDQLREDVGV